MEAWLLDRAEELDAGRGVPSWASTRLAEGAAVLPDSRSLTEEKGATPPGVQETTPRRWPAREDSRAEGMRGATVKESTVRGSPARAARGARRWD